MQVQTDPAYGKISSSTPTHVIFIVFAYYLLRPGPSESTQDPRTRCVRHVRSLKVAGMQDLSAVTCKLPVVAWDPVPRLGMEPRSPALGA